MKKSAKYNECERPEDAQSVDGTNEPEEKEAKESKVDHQMEIDHPRAIKTYKVSKNFGRLGMAGPLMDTCPTMKSA